MGAHLIDALDPNLSNRQFDAAVTAPDFEYKPSFFEGSISATGQGLGSGGMKTGLFAAATLDPIDQTIGQSMLTWRDGPEAGSKYAETRQQQLQRSEQDIARQIMALRPDARTTGVAGQVLFSLADVLPRAVAGSMVGGPMGGAAAVGLPEGYASYQVGMAEGLDPNTAATKGAIEGVSAGLGALIPGSGFTKSLAGDLALTVGANVGLGVVERQSVHTLLESRGYAEMAKQYDAWDTTAMLTDAVLGSAFWGIGRYGDIKAAVKPDRATVDAALASENAMHLQVESAIGVPADPRSLDVHTKQMEDSIQRLANGDPIQVDQRLADAEFVRGPVKESPLARQMREDYGDVPLREDARMRLDDMPYRAADGDAAAVPFEAPPDGADSVGAVTTSEGPAAASTGQREANPLDSSPTVQAARLALERYPDMELRLPDDNGNEITVRAADHLKRLADDDMKQAQVDAKAYEAAITCFLGSGI